MDGLRRVRGGPVVVGVFTATGAAAMGEGIFSVLLIPFLEILGGGAEEFGWLLTIRATGGIVGGLLLAKLGGRIRSETLFTLSLLLAGALGLVMFNLPALPIALAVLFLWGIPAMGAQASSQALLQSRVRDEYRGRVFGAYGMTATLLSVSGQTVAGMLAGHLGTTLMLNADAALYCLAGGAALALLPSSSRLPVREGADP
jgi:MFS family permease